MQRALATVLLLGLLVPAGRAAADETWSCWSVGSGDGESGTAATVTRCRIGGSRVQDYDTSRGQSPPAVLSPMVGVDASGTCWYWTSRPSRWILRTITDDGKALLAFDPDGLPGGPLVIDTLERACTSEPGDRTAPAGEAYQLLSAYLHPRPDPLLDPEPGRGITGMATSLSLVLPEPWQDALTSPATGRTLEVETWVEAVEVDWGDGTSTVLGVDAFDSPVRAGGPRSHVYEVKTCREGEEARCVEGYTIRATYRWAAHYRVDRGGWVRLAVEPTVTSVAYPVREVVGVVTGTA